MTDSLRDITERLRAFVAEREWEQFHDPKNLAMAVASEAGELLAEYRWISSGEADAWSQGAENKRRVAMEAADVAIALMLLCDRTGIDLLQAIDEKLEINAEHYPVNSSKGRHSRVQPRREHD